MAYRSVTEGRFIAAPPSRIWPYLADPRALAGHGEHTVSIEPDQVYTGAAGETWTEIHGPECDNDRVPCRVVSSVPEQTLTVATRQRGVKQTIEYTLTEVPAGTWVEEHITFSPVFEGELNQRLVSWSLLFTGLLAWAAKGMSETLSLLEQQVK